MAARAGARAPEVVIAALGPEGDAFVVTRQPDVEPLERSSADQVSDERCSSSGVRSTGCTARGSRTVGSTSATCLLTEDGPMLVDWAAATLGAPQSALDTDVAELTVAACTVLVGPDRAWRLAAVEAGVAPTPSVASFRTCNAAALTPHLRDLARKSEIGLKESAPSRSPRPPASDEPRASSRCAGSASS